MTPQGGSALHLGLTAQGRASDVCVALAATEDFLPGSLVAVSSFLARHPHFRGGLVLFHDGLPEDRCATLERAFPPLRLKPVGSELRQRAARLASSPLVPRRAPSDFYCLEAFRIDGYRKVLYCDSDVLFRQPIDDLFESREALVCCGDQPSVGGWCRDAATYQPIESPASAGPAGALERTFNSGMMLIDGCLTGEGTHAELLSLMEPESWRGTDTVHTDQFLLNRHFAGHQTLVSSTYNYPLHMAAAILAGEGLAAADARVLHFTGPQKPWNPGAMLRWPAGEPPFAPHPAYSWWYAAWIDCLTHAHLKDAVRQGFGSGMP